MCITLNKKFTIIIGNVNFSILFVSKQTTNTYASFWCVGEDLLIKLNNHLDLYIKILTPRLKPGVRYTIDI